VLFKEAEHFISYGLYRGFSSDVNPEGVIAPHPYELAVAKGEDELPEDAWSHLALTDDGEELSLYVDGELAEQTETTGPVTSEGPLRIGCTKDWEETFTGKIDEVRLYDRALGEGEIGEDQETEITSTYSKEPVASYSFDEGSGRVLHDDSGNEHDGKIEGAQWAEGKFSSALKFDGGEEECASIPDSPQLQLSNEFTLEAWVRPEGEDEYEPVIFKEDEWAYTYSLFAGMFKGGRYPEGSTSYYPYSHNTVEGKDEPDQVRRRPF
jgi:hypothetical protein